MTTAQRIAALQPLIDAGTATDEQRREYEAEKAILSYSKAKNPQAKERNRAKMAEYRCNRRAELYEDARRYYREHREEILERKRRKKCPECQT